MCHALSNTNKVGVGHHLVLTASINGMVVYNKQRVHNKFSFPPNVFPHLVCLVWLKTQFPPKSIAVP